MTEKQTSRTLHHHAHLLAWQGAQPDIGPGVGEGGQAPQQGLEGGRRCRRFPPSGGGGDGAKEAEAAGGARAVVAAAGEGEGAGVEEGGEGGEHLQGGAVDVFD